MFRVSIRIRVGLSGSVLVWVRVRVRVSIRIRVGLSGSVLVWVDCVV